MIHITDEDIREDLDELVDDHHSEKVLFVRDDTGTWYFQTNTDHGQYSATSWWQFPEEATATVFAAEEIEKCVPSLLDIMLDAAREIGDR